MVGGTQSQVWMVGGRVPHPRSGWWGGGGTLLARSGLGVPHPRSGGGVPGVLLARSGWWGGGKPPARSGWLGGYLGYPPTTMTGWGTSTPTSLASTSYAAGGMPLAFTQEDFLVIYIALFVKAVANPGGQQCMPSPYCKIRS